VNSKGYLVNKRGDVVDKDGKVLFLKKHLMEDEIPKIFPFTRFDISSVQGEFDMDPLGMPILECLGDGEFRDRKGQRVNQKGYLVDKAGNVINKHGKVQFFKDVLEPDGDIPPVFRTGLLRTGSGSSISRLMSELDPRNRSSFDDLEQEIFDSKM
jgi:hypothetical protein